MTKIMSIKDLKNISEISELVMKQIAMDRTIEISEKQIEAGKVKDARMALKETRAKYGL